MKSISNLYRNMLQEAPRAKMVTCPHCGTQFDANEKTAKPDTGIAGSPPEDIDDIHEFGRIVQAAANKTKNPKMDNGKRLDLSRVFISDVAKKLGVKNMQKFKKKLVDANRASALSLARADFSNMMNQQDVKDSETTYLSSEWHYIKKTA